MNVDSESYDIESAVDQLSDRIFNQRKGNVFLSLLCGRKRIQIIS